MKYKIFTILFILSFSFGNTIFAEERPIWTNAEDEVLGVDGQWYQGNHEAIWRWREACQHAFAARMDWAIKDYKEANHPPIAHIDNEVFITTKKGEHVELSTKGSSDPDGIALSYEWFCYKEAGTFPVSSSRTGIVISIQSYDQPEAWFTIPTKRVIITIEE